MGRRYGVNSLPARVWEKGSREWGVGSGMHREWPRMTLKLLGTRIPLSPLPSPLSPVRGREGGA